MTEQIATCSKCDKEPGFCYKENVPDGFETEPWVRHFYVDADGPEIGGDEPAIAVRESHPRARRVEIIHATMARIALRDGLCYRCHDEGFKPYRGEEVAAAR